MTTDYKGISIAFTDTKNGRDTLVLLHGFLENKNMWQPFIEPLSEKYRIISIDLLGHGQTGCLGYVHTMEQMADFVYAVLNHLKVDHVKLVGHSMGGYVALAYAEKYTKQVTGICLMNSTALPDTKEKQLNRDRAIKAIKQNPKTFIRLSINNLFMPANRERLKNEIELVMAEALKIPMQGIIAALEGMKIRENRTHIFENPNVDNLLIIGKNDPVIPIESLKEQRQHAKTVIFDGGHMSHIENKTEFLQTLLAFAN
ncbi:MAG: alpha/beta fold hydrolase [Aestuariibaculum sp.]